MNDLAVKLDIPVEWSKVNHRALASAVERGALWNSSFANLPQICSGPAYLCHKVCYSYMNAETTIGDRCLPEVAMVINNTKNYMDSLGVEPSNFVDMTMIKDLVSCDMKIERCNRILAVEPMIKDIAVSMNNHGDKLYMEQIHMAKLILDQEIKSRQQILKSLNATRAEKAKTGSKNDLNISKILLNAKKLIAR